jgi:branched-subunit amino acid transport protein
MISVRNLLLILGMTLVTFIPRAVPAVLIDKLRFSLKVEKFLKLIPYTAMAALIFPGILATDAENIWIGIAGGAVACAFAWMKCPVMVCVLAAIGADFLLYVII